MPQTVTCLDMYGGEHIVGVDQLEWRPSVYAIVVRAGALLVSPQLNGYDLPGGGLEFGESFEQAVTREVKEETGVDITNPILVHSDVSFFTFTIENKQRYFHSLLHYYVADYAGGELSNEGFTNDEKLTTLFPEWLPLDEFDAKVAANGFGSSYDWRPLLENVKNNS